MDTFADEIHQALVHRLPHLALIGALNLPAIAVALEAPDGIPTRQGYIAWCKQWFMGKYPELTVDDLLVLWSGRELEAHQQTRSATFRRVVFTLADESQDAPHRTVIHDALIIQLDRFCHDMIEAYGTWRWMMKDHPRIVTNATTLLRLRKEGYAPYVQGRPVLA